MSLDQKEIKEKLIESVRNFIKQMRDDIDYGMDDDPELGLQEIDMHVDSFEKYLDSIP